MCRDWLIEEHRVGGQVTDTVLLGDERRDGMMALTCESTDELTRNRFRFRND